jgi:hypothetical protein
VRWPDYGDYDVIRPRPRCLTYSKFTVCVALLGPGGRPGGKIWPQQVPLLMHDSSMPHHNHLIALYRLVGTHRALVCRTRSFGLNRSFIVCVAQLGPGGRPGSEVWPQQVPLLMHDSSMPHHNHLIALYRLVGTHRALVCRTRSFGLNRGFIVCVDRWDLEGDPGVKFGLYKYRLLLKTYDQRLVRPL